MELDNLKEAWAELDNRLKRNEELKESIILEMMQSKAGKLVNRFIIWEMISFALLLLLIPFCIFAVDRFGGKIWTWDIFMYFLAAVCFFGTFWSAYKLHGLMKIDLLKNVGNNIYFVNRYNIQLKREKKITDCFVGPVFVILFAFILVALKATLPMWTLGICVFASCGLVTYLLFKRYRKNIDSILRSLDEIRELKEE
jgi:4-hydroxybenzoate polyprenyltransferase